MGRASLIALFAALYLATMAGAAPQAPPATAPTTVPAPAAAAPPTNDLDEIVCRTTAIVGSRLSSRLCLSKRRWAQMHDDAQGFIQDIQNRSSGGQQHGF